MIKLLGKLLGQSLSSIKADLRAFILSLMIAIVALSYALVRSRYEVKSGVSDGKQQLIDELRTTITESSNHIDKLQAEKDSLINLAGKLSIKNVVDSVKSNTRLIDQNQNFIEKQNEIKRSMK